MVTRPRSASARSAVTSSKLSPRLLPEGPGRFLRAWSLPLGRAERLRETRSGILPGPSCVYGLAAGCGDGRGLGARRCAPLPLHGARARDGFGGLALRASAHGGGLMQVLWRPRASRFGPCGGRRTRRCAPSQASWGAVGAWGHVLRVCRCSCYVLRGSKYENGPSRCLLRCAAGLLRYR